MKKVIIILCILGTLAIGVLWGAKRAFMPILTGILNTYLKTVDTPYLTVRFDKAEDTCWLRPCLQIQNLYIRVLDKEFHGGTVAIEVPYKWPIGVDIKSVETNTSDITINASFNDNKLNVQNLNMKSGDFSADVNGWLDTQTLKFNADMNTQNLARFLKPYIPQNMDFISNLFLSDAQQNLKLADKDGWLTIGGFPVFPLDMNTLSGFLNLNTTAHTNTFDTLDDFNTFDKAVTSSSQGLNLNDLGALLGNVLK